MIHKIECVMVECDNCKDPLDYNGYGIFVDEIAAEDARQSAEWHEEKGKHLCDKCHVFDDNDQLIIDASRKKEEPYMLPAKDTGINFGKNLS